MVDRLSMIFFVQPPSILPILWTIVIQIYGTARVQVSPVESIYPRFDRSICHLWSRTKAKQLIFDRVLFAAFFVVCSFCGKFAYMQIVRTFAYAFLNRATGNGRRVSGDVGRASSWGARCAACIHMLHLRLYAKSRSRAKEGVFLIASTCANYQWDCSSSVGVTARSADG